MLIRNHRSRSRRGGVLVATLVLVMTIAGVAACLFQLDSARARRQVASIDNKRAFNLAEAGLAEAYYGLLIGKTGQVGSEAAPAGFGGGLFWVEATELEENVIGLESTGMCGSGRATLSLIVHIDPNAIAALGVLGGNQVTLGVNAQVDAYDSRGGEPPDGSLQLQSNGDIQLMSGAVVNGDASPGPEGAVVLAPDAHVTGSTAPNAAAVELPPIEIPEIASAGDIEQTALRPMTLSGEEQAYGTLKVGEGSELVLQGPATIVVENLNVANTGKLTFDTTAGPVKLFVNNWLNLTSGSLVQFSGTTPSDVSIFVSASGFHDRDGDGIKDLAARFLCSPPFYGSLYAPGANVTLPPGFEFFGAISAQKLTFNEGARVHFDVALEALNAETEGSVEKLSWRVIEIPVAIARSFDESPFELLGVVEGSLDAPVDAHPDPGFLIHIMYRDLGDTLLSYRGPEAAFDWSNVKSVVQIVRTLP